MIIGVTGHREVEQEEPGELDQFARLSVARMIEAGATEIITGMAWGFDISVALACCELNVPFVAMLPFIGQHRFWQQERQSIYVNLLADARRIEVVGNTALNVNYIRRDRRIVDECEELWSLDSKRPSGTHTTVLYAETRGRKIVPLWEDWIAFRAERK